MRPQRAAAGAAGAAGAAATALSFSASASDDHVHPPALNWNHKGFFSGFDHASIRRGHQVYQEVCASCHSMDLIAYRNLVGVAYSEEELKAMAAEQDVEGGPNAEGEMFLRPGKLSDRLPRPYPNNEAGASANGGALPPDLSLITKARHGGEDYVFALLTGYHEQPAGLPPARDGQYYNPYFPGGYLAMPGPLIDNGQVEYADGTPATMSQMAKDVSTFLAWAANPELEERKQFGIKTLATLGFMFTMTAYYKRFRWASLKTRKISYKF